MFRPRTSVILFTLFLLSSFPLLAQNWPWPVRVGETPVLSPLTGDPLYPYDSPIKDHAGRFVDSSQMRDCQAGPRTLRAKGGRIDPQSGTLMMMIGETFVGYPVSSFFQSIGGSLTSAGISHPSGCGTNQEQYLPWPRSVYPEAPGSGWVTEVKDGQQRLFDFDTDERGYVYLAYSVFGMGIIQAADFSLVKQMPRADAGEVHHVQHFKHGSNHYLYTDKGIWDVTVPTSPTYVRAVPVAPYGFGESSNSIETISTAGGDVIAIMASGSTINLYRAADLTASGSGVAFAQVPAAMGWYSMATDGTTLWAGDAAVNLTSSRIVTISPTTGSVSESTELGAMRVAGMEYSQGHLTVWGFSRTTFEVRLLQRAGNGWVDRPLGDFFSKHYYYPPVGYAGYTGYGLPWQLLYVQNAGREYVIFSFHGVGDVYEIESADRLNISYDGVSGTANPNTPATSTGAYYGDPLLFSSSYEAGSIQVNWNFGNPEGIASENLQTRPVGQNVVYQYAGLGSAAGSPVTRTVSGTDVADSTNQSTVNVTMKKPSARLRVVGSTKYFEGTSPVTTEFAAGQQLIDGSDGRIESHYGQWTLDGVATAASPSTSFSVGACGSHVLSYAARYVPYTGSGTSVTPKLASGHYVSTLGTINYDVRPFIPAVTTTSDGTNVTFRNQTKYNAATFVAGSQWTVTWSLMNGSTRVIPDETDVSVIGTADEFVVPLAQLQTGYTVNMTVAVAAAAIADVSCATAPLSSSATYVVQPPDPKITVSGCTVAKGSCQLTADSISGADVTKWTFAWKRNGSTVATTRSYEPSFTEGGTYQISLVATNELGSKQVDTSLTLEAPLCSGAPENITFGATGLSSGCGGTNCTAGEQIQFTVYAWKYTIQDCDTFSWNFGDGTTSSVRNPVHTFPTSSSTYQVKLTVTNDSGSTSYQSSVVFGSSNPPPPPPPACSKPGAGTVFPTFSGSVSGCSATDPNCVMNESIQFTGSTWGYNPDLSCDTFSWSFGDGGTSNQRHPSHTYTSQGTYTVRFTITNSGGSESGTTTITIGEPIDPNCRKEAVLLDLSYTGATSGCSTTQSSTGCLTGEQISFAPVTWQYNWQPCDEFAWDFGDGTTSNEQNPTHVYDASQNGRDVVVKLTVSNKHGSTTVSRTFLVGTPATPPTTASFTASASRPKPGEPVTFTAATQGGDPATSWQWSFGDGATGSGQTVTHTYAAEGSYKVGVTATNSGGSAYTEKTIKVSETITYLLPVVTHAGGLNGTTWRTDLHVFLPEFVQTGAIEVQLDFKGTSKSIFFDSSTEIFEDFLGEITSADDAGPVFLHTPVPLDMWTRTYNVSASGVGTFGQLIPAVLLGESGQGAVADQTFWNLGGLRNSGRFRTNLGFVNPTGQRSDVTVHLYEETFGLEIGKFDVSVDPGQLRQQPLGTWFASLPADQGLSLRIQSRNGVDVVAYASIIDNISNDPVYVGAVPDHVAADPAGRTVIIPGVGHFGSWRSDLTIFNPDSQAVSMDLEFYGNKTNEDGSVSVGVKLGEAPGVVLPSKSSLTVENLLQSTLLNIEGDVIGTLKVTTTSENEKFPIVFDRTYNDQLANGTFGQGIPAIPAAEGNVRAGAPAILPGIRNDAAYYTNLGLVSLSEETTEVWIAELQPNDGRPRNSRLISLAPNESVIISKLLPQFLFSDLSRATIQIEVRSGGPVWAYGSVVDDLTKDPEYVPAVPAAPGTASLIIDTVEE